jgi:hypothetical protein
MAKTPRCPAMSTRFCIVREAGSATEDCCCGLNPTLWGALPEGGCHLLLKRLSHALECVFLCA